MKPVMRYTVYLTLEGKLLQDSPVDIDADSFVAAEGWVTFFVRQFAQGFGVVTTTIAAYRMEDVKYIEGAYIGPPEPTKGLELVTN